MNNNTTDNHSGEECYLQNSRGKYLSPLNCLESQEAHLNTSYIANLKIIFNYPSDDQIS